MGMVLTGYPILRSQSRLYKTGLEAGVFFESGIVFTCTDPDILQDGNPQTAGDIYLNMTQTWLSLCMQMS